MTVGEMTETSLFRSPPRRASPGAAPMVNVETMKPVAASPGTWLEEVAVLGISMATVSGERMS